MFRKLGPCLRKIANNAFQQRSVHEIVFVGCPILMLPIVLEVCKISRNCTIYKMEGFETALKKIGQLTSCTLLRTMHEVVSIEITTV